MHLAGLNKPIGQITRICSALMINKLRSDAQISDQFVRSLMKRYLTERSEI